ncbi:hypothetical protein BJV78DRAFT_1209773 [Lactifluus subvellereus]|nr:hypothetical protein BJV78DRAFT_1209773 [Lactifluus subvellereus]
MTTLLRFHLSVVPLEMGTGLSAPPAELCLDLGIIENETHTAPQESTERLRGDPPDSVASNEPMPTPSQHVRMQRNARIRTNPEDLPDPEFCGYNPTSHSDEERLPAPPEAETDARTGARAEARAGRAPNLRNWRRESRIQILLRLRLAISNLAIPSEAPRPTAP